MLVKALIARGWTQRQLAEAVGMAEQQIQRYEANDYRSTSLARLCGIATVAVVSLALAEADVAVSPMGPWSSSRPIDLPG